MLCFLSERNSCNSLVYVKDLFARLKAIPFFNNTRRNCANALNGQMRKLTIKATTFLFRMKLCELRAPNTNDMNMWSSQWIANLSNCEIAREKFFRGFNGIRTRGLCVRAAMLYQLSFEDPYTESRPRSQCMGLHNSAVRLLQPAEHWDHGFESRWSPEKRFFFGLFRNCLNCDSLRWSHIHFINIFFILLYCIRKPLLASSAFTLLLWVKIETRQAVRNACKFSFWCFSRFSNTAHSIYSITCFETCVMNNLH